MKTIEILVIQNLIHITGDAQNFMVTQKEHDLDCPVGFGSTQEKAIESFKTSWALHNEDEEIETKIVTI